MLLDDQRAYARPVPEWEHSIFNYLNTSSPIFFDQPLGEDLSFGLTAVSDFWDHITRNDLAKAIAAAVEEQGAQVRDYTEYPASSDWNQNCIRQYLWRERGCPMRRAQRR